MPQILIGSAIVGGAGAAVFKLLASGAEDAGQAIDSTGSGVLKLAIAAGVGYAIAKKLKVV